jgi:hypothetical protein
MMTIQLIGKDEDEDGDGYDGVGVERWHDYVEKLVAVGGHLTRIRIAH